MTLGLAHKARTALSLSVWCGAAIAAGWLYRGASGMGDAVAIAQAREYRIGPAVLGRLVSLEAVEGQRVQRGQVVARLETEMVEREKSVAEARLQYASSQVAATGTSLDIGFLQTERAFETEIESVRVEMEAARASSSKDRAELARLSDDLDRERGLVRRGLTRSDRLQELELKRTALEEAVKSWPPRMKALDARAEAAASRLAEWRRAHSPVPGGPRNAQIQPARDKVREERETLKMLGSRLGNTVLRASADGYVTAILARPGDVVRAGDPVVVIVETRPRQVVAWVEERKGAVPPVGAAVQVRRTAAGGQQFGGTVAAVTTQVSQLPQRLWSSPHLPAWGRAVYINLPETAAVDPGEMLDVRLDRHDGAAARQVASERRAQVTAAP